MEPITIILITVAAIVLAVAVFALRRPREYYPAESCGYTCPNMGACDDCDCGYP